MERDILLRGYLASVGNFNSHAHVERDSGRLSAMDCAFYFNSHAHVERDSNCTECFCNALNFNSHAHVERDWHDLEEERHEIISTHTLTWSVTNEQPTADVQEVISTHTLTWSVTKKILSVVCIWQFQLTRSRGA